MKSSCIYVLLLVIGLATCNSIQAQIITIPEASSFATITQKVGFNEMKIEYSRPNVQGRVIFGELVPFGKVWRVGANASTKIYVQEPVTIQDEYKLPAGVYALYAVPEKTEWTIIFSRDPWRWGAFADQEQSDAVRIKVKPQPLKEQVETFTIQFANICSSCAEVQLLWDFTKVSFRISTDVDEKVIGDIKAFTSNPESKLAGEYFMAAKYYLDTNRDLKQALEWINKSLFYGPDAYWVMHTKAEIQAKMGDYKGAIETAVLSKEKAKAINDDDYVRMNDLEIAKWKELKKSGTN